MRIQRSFDEHDAGTLYIVGTPIGHLKDLTPRAKEVLQQVHLIAAEDTRHTRKLLSHFGMDTPLVSYHQHNAQTKDEMLVEHLRGGGTLALVSDAGLPGISDPGETLVARAIQHSIPVVPIPGPSAALCALVASGLPMQPFLFIGFLPRRSKRRKEELGKWKNLEATLLFYEAPHRLLSTLVDVQEVLGDRQVAISRELTKVNEEWLRGTMGECIAHIRSTPPRGEYTIVVEGVSPEEVEGGPPNPWEAYSLVQHVDIYISQGYTKKDAIQQVAKDRDMPRREVYNQYHSEV